MILTYHTLNGFGIKNVFYLKNDLLYNSKDIPSYISFEDLVQLSRNTFDIIKNNINATLDNCLEPREGDSLYNFIGDKYVVDYTNYGIKPMYDKIPTGFHIIRDKKNKNFSDIKIGDKTFYLFSASLSSAKVSPKPVMDLSFTTIVSSEQLRHWSIVRFNEKASIDNHNLPIFYNISENTLKEFKPVIVDGTTIFTHQSGVMLSENDYLKKKLSL